MFFYGNHDANQRIYECPQCFTAISYKDKYCSNCGDEVHESTYAYKPTKKNHSIFSFKYIKRYNSPCCNTSLHHGDKFCSDCGKKFTVEEAHRMMKTENKSVAIALMISFFLLLVFFLIFDH